MQLGEHLNALREWAAPKGLEIVATQGDQREPENVVAIREPGGGPTLLRRTSMDSVDIAAVYVVATLERLGVELSRERGSSTQREPGGDS